MKKILLVLISSLFINLQAQNFEWAKREGLWAYDYGYGIATDNMGNVYISGKYELYANFSDTILPCQGNHDIFVARYSSTGELDWIRTAGGSTGDYARALSCDGSNVYIAGEIQGYGTIITFVGTNTTLKCIGDNDIFLAKYDLNGNLLWAKSAGGINSDKALGITNDNALNVYICGYFSGDQVTFDENTTIYGNGGRDIFIAKYDRNGNFIWARQAGSPERDEAASIKCDAVGNIYICGMYSDKAIFGTDTLNSPNGKYNTYVAKYNSNGTLKWVRPGGGNFNDVAWSLTLDNANKIYVTGEFTGNALFNGIPLTTAGGADVFVSCYDTLGNIKWAKRGGGDLLDRTRGIGCDGTNIYITGQFSHSATFGSHVLNGPDNSDIFIVGLDNTGKFIWATAVGGPADSTEPLGYESGIAICAEPSGNLYVTGSLLDGGDFGSISLDKYSRTDVFITKITQGADLTAPKVNTFSPPDNAIDIVKNTSLTLTFNEAIKKGTGNIIIKEAGIVMQTIPVSDASVTITSNKAIINPSVDFTDGASVNIEMAAGVFKDMANNNYIGITDSSTWNFTVEDLTPPTVTSYSPDDDSVNVMKDANLIITFSEPIQKGIGNILIKERGIITQTIPISGTNVSISGNTVTVDPEFDFTDSISINIEMTTGVFRDNSNNDYTGIADDTTWNFKTADVTAPITISYMPADDTINVEKNTNLIITFNEAVQMGTGNISIKENGIVNQTIPVSGSNVTISGNNVIIDPLIDFSDTALVNIEIPTGVFKDMSYNDYTGISNATTWNFKIVDGLAPVINAYIPADDTFDVAKNTNLIITFNEPVQKGIGDIIVKEAGIVKQLISVTGTNVVISDNVVSIDPPFDFNDNASVNVEMGIGVFEDMANNKCAGINNAATWDFKIATTMSLGENNSSRKFNIYPNPNNGNFIVDLLQMANQKVEISTFNFLGQLINKGTYKSPCKVNVELPDQGRGIYFIEIELDQTTFREKIVFQ